VKYRKVSPVIWQDERFRVFSDDGKLAFLFVLTHPGLTSVGAMRGTPAGLAAELGWPVRRLTRALGEAVAAGMVEVNVAAAFVGLPKFLKHNQPDNPSVVKSWVRVIAEYLPECPERTHLLARCRAALTGPFLDAFTEAEAAAFPAGNSFGSPCIGFCRGRWPHSRAWWPRRSSATPRTKPRRTEAGDEPCAASYRAERRLQAR
jgi:hypothetical protein